MEIWKIDEDKVLRMGFYCHAKFNDLMFSRICQWYVILLMMQIENSGKKQKKSKSKVQRPIFPLGIDVKLVWK